MHTLQQTLPNNTPKPEATPEDEWSRYFAGPGPSYDSNNDYSLYQGGSMENPLVSLKNASIQSDDSILLNIDDS